MRLRTMTFSSSMQSEPMMMGAVRARRVTLGWRTVREWIVIFPLNVVSCATNAVGSTENESGLSQRISESYEEGSRGRLTDLPFLAGRKREAHGNSLFRRAASEETRFDGDGDGQVIQRRARVPSVRLDRAPARISPRTELILSSFVLRIAEIGCGAYGTVCSALQVATGNKVAIKKVSPLSHSMFCLRTLREIKLLRWFNHENIISILDIVKPNSLEEFTDVYLIQVSSLFF